MKGMGQVPGNQMWLKHKLGKHPIVGGGRIELVSL